MVIKSKIKSFTVVEMLLVLLITSIVIGIVFSVHQFVSSQFHQKKVLYKINGDINLFEKKVWRSLNNSITYINNQDSGLIFKQGNLESNLYIDENVIVFDGDTLHLKTNEFYYYNKGLEVDKGRVDAVKLIIEIKPNLEREVFAFKQEDVESILNNEDYNGK